MLFYILRLSSLLLTLSFLASCDSIPFVDNSPDYKGAGRSKSLELPPDLSSTSNGTAYDIPASTATFSDYIKSEKDAQKKQILPEVANVKLERAGTQRWLVVSSPPENVWPIVKEFWMGIGFSIVVENMQTGILETSWIDVSDLKKNDRGVLDKFDAWLDKLNNLSNRQKFRTRLERGTVEGTTEIYLTHRILNNGLENKKEIVQTRFGNVDTGYKNTKNLRTQSEKELADAEEIDADLLRRLMVKLGVSEEKSKSLIENKKQGLGAQLLSKPDGNVLLVKDAFDRAWRRVGLALERVNFLVEDKNRGTGIYFIKHMDVDESEKSSEKKSWFDFGSSNVSQKNDTSQLYQVMLTTQKNGVLIQVLDAEGKPLQDKTRINHILTLLYEQLK